MTGTGEDDGHSKMTGASKDDRDDGHAEDDGCAKDDRCLEDDRCVEDGRLARVGCWTWRLPTNVCIHQGHVKICPRSVLKSLLELKWSHHESDLGAPRTTRSLL